VGRRHGNRPGAPDPSHAGTPLSEGISLGYLAVLLVGFALWLSYGVSLHNLALIVPNTLAFVACATTITIVLRFRRRD
jgi:MtN3 and saliva related transmembrane protein